MKKLVLRLDLEDDKAKQKAMKAVSTLQGIDSIVIDMKAKKMTVIGTVDPVNLVSKLRKYWQADIITVGSAKEPEKKEEAKSAAAAAASAPVEGKKEGGKKEEGKEDGGKEEGKGEKKKEEGGGGKEGGGRGKKEEGEAPKKTAMMLQPIPEHLLETVRARQYNPYGNNPPYMAMANPYINHPHMHHQPTYYVQSVEENPNGCTIF